MYLIPIAAMLRSPKGKRCFSASFSFWRCSSVLISPKFRKELTYTQRKGQGEGVIDFALPEGRRV